MNSSQIPNSQSHQGMTSINTTTSTSTSNQRSSPSPPFLSQPSEPRKLTIEEASQYRFQERVSKGIATLIQHGYSVQGATRIVLMEISSARAGGETDNETQEIGEDEVFRWMKSLGHGVDETMTALIISNAYERIKSQKQVSADRAMDYLSSRISTMKLLAHVETQKNGTTRTDRKKIGGGGLLAKAHIQHPSEEGNGHGHGYGSGIRVKTNPVQQHEVLENGSSTDPVPINVSHRTPSTTCSTTATTTTAATKSKITTPSSELSKPNPSESKTRKQIQSSSSSKSQPKNKPNTLKPNTNTKNSNNTNTKQSTTTACGKNLKSSCNSIRGKRTLLAATLEEHTQELLSQSSCTKRPRLDSV